MPSFNAIGQLVFFAWVLAVQVVGLYIFGTGFFLTRIELPDKSKCNVSDLLTDEETEYLSSAARAAPSGEGCWLPRRYRRAVWVVIDALRFDFATYDPSARHADATPEDLAPGGAGGAAAAGARHYYTNRLPVIHEVLSGSFSGRGADDGDGDGGGRGSSNVVDDGRGDGVGGDGQDGGGDGGGNGGRLGGPKAGGGGGGRALLFEFEADPPTVTMQRLKGLTTGGLPTFIDFRNNFHSPVVKEDNWVDQLSGTAGNHLVFMGDDTWASLYPTQFGRSFPFPSFNTRDLHTVDDGVLRHLGAELARDDWDVMVVHFLGVDHVGHTFGPDSPAMAAKLAQMDGALRRLFEGLGEDTLCLVMGDHGMTDSGNHGGATAAETGAALLVYSKSPLLGQQQRQRQRPRPTPLPTTAGAAAVTAAAAAVAAAAAAAATTGVGRGSGNGTGGGITGGSRVPRGGSSGGMVTWDDAAGGMVKQAHPELWSRKVAQIDLVPTLSLLLGAPVPFGSLGGAIPELFFGCYLHEAEGGDAIDGSADFGGDDPGGGDGDEVGGQPKAATAAAATIALTDADAYERLSDALLLNCLQVSRYLEAYATAAALPEAAMAGLRQQLAAARWRHREHRHHWRRHRPTFADHESGGRLRAVCAEYRAYLRAALALGRRLWTQYDLPRMYVGLGVLAALVAALAARTMFHDGSGGRSGGTGGGNGSSDRTDCGERSDGGTGGRSGGDGTGQRHLEGPGETRPRQPASQLAFAAFAGMVGAVCGSVVNATHPALGFGLDAVVAGAAIGSSVGVVWRSIYAALLRWSVRRAAASAASVGGRASGASVPPAPWQWPVLGFEGVVTAVIAVLSCAGLFSNSYIEGEHVLHLFLGASMLLAMAIAAAGAGSGGNYTGAAAHFAGAALCLRLAEAASSGYGMDVAAAFSPLRSLAPLPLLWIGCAAARRRLHPAAVAATALRRWRRRPFLRRPASAAALRNEATHLWLQGLSLLAIAAYWLCEVYEVRRLIWRLGATAASQGTTAAAAAAAAALAGADMGAGPEVHHGHQHDHDALELLPDLPHEGERGGAIMADEIAIYPHLLLPRFVYVAVVAGLLLALPRQGRRRWRRRRGDNVGGATVMKAAGRGGNSGAENVPVVVTKGRAAASPQSGGGGGGGSGSGEDNGADMTFVPFLLAQLAAVITHVVTAAALLLGPRAPLTLLLALAAAHLATEGLQGRRSIATVTVTVAPAVPTSGPAARGVPALHPSAGGTAAAAVLMWAECGRSLFFLTGHHNQFSRLQYACAFIGFDEFHFRAAGALLFVNTFGTEILAALAFPEVAAARMAAAQATAAVGQNRGPALLAGSGTSGASGPAAATMLEGTEGTSAGKSGTSSGDGESDGGGDVCSSSGSGFGGGGSSGGDSDDGEASLLRELARLCLLHALLNSARMLLSAANVALQRDHLMLWAVFAPKFLFDTVMQVVGTAVAVATWALVTGAARAWRASEPYQETLKSL